MQVVFGLEKLCQTTRGKDTEEAMQSYVITLNHPRQNRERKREKETNNSLFIRNLCPAAMLLRLGLLLNPNASIKAAHDVAVSERAFWVLWYE